VFPYLITMFRSLTFSVLLATLIALPAYSQMDPIEDRIAYAKGILDEGLRKNDSVLIAEGYYLLAKRMLDINNIDEAYNMFYISLKINEKLKDYYKMGRIYKRLAEAEIDQGNFEGAQEFLNESVSIFKKHNLEDTPESTHFEAGLIHTSLHNFNESLYAKINPDSVLHYFRKREKKALAENNRLWLAVTRFQIGNVYLYKKDNRALSYLENAVEIVQNDSLPRPALMYQNGLAEAYITLGQLDKAKRVLSESREMIGKGSLFPSSSLAKHYNTYAKYYAAVKDWENAYISKDSASQYLIHLVESDRTGNISRWRVQLETEKKDLQLRFQKQEIAGKQSLIEQQQVFMGVVAVLLSGLAVISCFLYKNYKKQKRLSEKNAVLIHEQNHRVKNNLQVISSLLNLQNDYIRDDTSRQVLSESQSRIDAMALLHRQLYENDQVELINIENLFSDIIHSVGHTFGADSLQLRLPLEVTRLGTDTATSVGLILNELTINSFKYAFRGREPVIEVSSRKNGNTIHIIYKDFGSTDLSDIFSNPDKKGFGLNLIDMILFQINGTLTYDFKNDSSITLSFTDA